MAEGGHDGGRRPGEGEPVPSDTTRFVLVRHGETTYNREGRFQGADSDPHLTARGREQARAVADELEGVDFEALYTSDLLRAIETAQVLAEAVGALPRMLEGLREMSHGDWEGKTRAEILETWPEEHAANEHDPRGVARPGGDSYGDLAARVWPLFERLADHHRGERVLVVTHGGPIRLVLSDVTGTPLTQRDKLGVDNGRWFVVEKAGDTWRVAEGL